MGRVYAKAAFVPTRGLDRGCGFLKGAKSLSDHAPHDEGDGHHQHDQWKRDMLQHLAHGLDQRVLRRQIVECQAVEKDDRCTQQDGADKSEESKPSRTFARTGAPIGHADPSFSREPPPRMVWNAPVAAASSRYRDRKSDR